jgi:hypothetical protein
MSKISYRDSMTGREVNFGDLCINLRPAGVVDFEDYIGDRVLRRPDGWYLEPTYRVGPDRVREGTLHKANDREVEFLDQVLYGLLLAMEERLDWALVQEWEIRKGYWTGAELHLESDWRGLQALWDGCAAEARRIAREVVRSRQWGHDLFPEQIVVWADNMARYANAVARWTRDTSKRRPKYLRSVASDYGRIPAPPRPRSTA